MHYTNKKKQIPYRYAMQQNNVEPSVCIYAFAEFELVFDVALPEIPEPGLCGLLELTPAGNDSPILSVFVEHSLVRLVHFASRTHVLYFATVWRSILIFEHMPSY